MSDDAVEAFRLECLIGLITQPQKCSENRSGGELTTHTCCLQVSQTKVVPNSIAVRNQRSVSDSYPVLLAEIQQTFTGFFISLDQF